jgi:hypothetical protein
MIVASGQDSRVRFKNYPMRANDSIYSTLQQRIENSLHSNESDSEIEATHRVLSFR